MKAIILKKNLFSEGNEILTMYTRESGKVRAVARSVKSPKSRLSYALQTFFFTELEVLPNKKLPAVTSVKPLEVFAGIYSNPQKVAYAMYATEVLLKSTPDEEVNEDIFDLFLEFLRHLDSSDALKHSCADIFVLELLALSGYRLSIENCVVCGKVLSKDISFSNRRSGFVCKGCALKVSDAFVVSDMTYLLIAKHANKQSKQADYASIDAESGDLSGEVHRIVESFAKHILERDLNASGLLGKL
ncbi:MAG: DNA repair protein RecO (recombination protein O) [Candidatus Doudnabacteria bacterium Gr01-1014_77]|uniref:DNA repair protein RecO n=1 Tax=Candidatus Doudnabacteria bacterium Gr01-1014_77 TaxID=2017133 RepID=A0A554JCR3_9BACT|nr:MAG: DNA repair protein RecO (recombination protein O) [Candidatus Doudnabacteria bacterium Gr01-1014_77]